MKKVIALHSSKRKMNTYGILLQIKELLAKRDIDVEIISLYETELKDCLGCEHCVLKDSCVLDDDADALMEKLKNADGIILSSPVYLQQVSGKMKSFIDRTCKWFHRPVLYGKPILCLATTKGSGLKLTLDYLENVVLQWGAMPAGRIGRTIRNAKKPLDERELDKFVLLMNEPQKFSPNFSALMDFEVQKVLADKIVGLDEKYWTDMGWYDMSYYIPCRVNRLKAWIAKKIGNGIRKRMMAGAEEEDKAK